MPVPPAVSRFRPLVLSAAALALCLAGSVAARAADLGPIMVRTAAGQPFEASLALVPGADESIDALQIGIGSPPEYGWLEIERPAWVDGVDLAIADEEGETKVRLWTADPPPERRFSLLLVASSPQGRSLRQYDVVLYDPEVLQPKQADAPTELPADRPGDADATVASPAAPEAQTTAARPARRAQLAERGAPEVQRNLSISSAGTRLPTAALERRAQRLEENSAAQQRALVEANGRISDLQGQVEKLEKLLALKGVAPVAEAGKPAAAPKPPAAPAPAPAPPAKPAEAAPAGGADAGKPPPPAGEGPPANPAAVPADEAAAPTGGTASGGPDSTASDSTGPDSAAPAAVTPEPAPLTAALAGALDHPALPWLVGGAAATLVLAGAAWLWRRRRARRQAGEPE
ncbi:MAG: hypothetical protein FGM40_03175, partial [Rhodocyclaceae bacterium]|nr:hypothetical protein [Rhodocyclaceae bacterium]